MGEFVLGMFNGRMPGVWGRVSQGAGAGTTITVNGGMTIFICLEKMHFSFAIYKCSLGLKTLQVTCLPSMHRAMGYVPQQSITQAEWHTAVPRTQGGRRRVRKSRLLFVVSLITAWNTEELVVKDFFFFPFCMSRKIRGAGHGGRRHLLTLAFTSLQDA